MKTVYKSVVVQLARLGDLAQAWLLISRLSRLNEPDRTALIVDQRLEAIASLMVGRRNCYAVPVVRLQEKFKTGSLRQNWYEAVRIKAALADIRAECVINLNFHAPTASLAESVRAEEFRGARWSDIRAGIPSDSQLASLFEGSSGLRHGKKHLSDIWAEYAAVETTKQRNHETNFVPIKLPPSLIARGEELVEFSGVGTDVKPVGLIIGSGSKVRSLKSKSLQQIVKGISEVAPILLIGTQNDVEIADEILSNLKNSIYQVVSLCGRTDDLQELAAVLNCCQLALGVDTGALHLTAMVGTRCLGIYFGSMNYRETGPYGSDHVVITPDDPDYPCHERVMDSNPGGYADSISPDIITKVAVQMLTGNLDKYQPGVKIYSSDATADSLQWSDVTSKSSTYTALLSSEIVVSNVSFDT